MRNIAAITAFFLLAFNLLIPSQSTAAPSLWQSKVDPWVLQTAAQGETEFLVFLQQQADLSGAEALKTKQEKGTYVFEQLTQTAARTQGPLLAALEEMGIDHRSFWIANMIWVRGGAQAVHTLSLRRDVAHIYANPQVRLQEPFLTPALPTFPQTTDAVEWNIAKVNAPQLWSLGFTGQGAVIAGQDTGYDWEHPALKNQYRGWDGNNADHNYNWHDAIHISSNTDCPPDRQKPCDDYGHGTHTMGTMLGDDGNTNKIGMAPGARWVGCRNMDEGFGTPSTYSECYQWFLAPTDLNDNNPRSDLAPDVINNSWGCPTYEGCTDPNVLLTVVENVRLAGILTVHSAGNYGSQGCFSVRDPAAIYDASFTVGATDSIDVIAGFSSRGPVSVDGSYRLKPDVSAPGVNIRSCVPGNGYASMQGTSMAAPHVAGLVALLISAYPQLAGQVDALENMLKFSALPRTTEQTCGDVSGLGIPNNTYGFGRIDAYAAYNWLHSAYIPLVQSIP